MGARDSARVGKPVEPLIEREDAVDSTLLHDCQMDRIPGGELVFPQQDGLRALNVFRLDREDVVHQPEQGIEGGLHGIEPADCRGSAQDLLKNFGIADELLVPSDQRGERLLGGDLVGMGRSDEERSNR